VWPGGDCRGDRRHAGPLWEERIIVTKTTPLLRRVTRVVRCGAAFRAGAAVVALACGLGWPAGQAGAGAVLHAVRGDSATIALEPMPPQHRAESGSLLALFAASPDSSFWCGPVRPHPHSWLSPSVIVRDTVDFRIDLGTDEGIVIESFAFLDVAPGFYRVGIERGDDFGRGVVLLRYSYEQAVVHECRIALP
jgi:hypothetical protein